MIYHFERRGRSPSVLMTLVAVWAGIVALTIVFDISLWITIGLMAFTLPAVWDLLRNSHARIEVWPHRLVWRASFSDGDRSDIDHVRLNRRFDGSMKVTLVHVGGATTRLPPDIAPPPAAFEAALKQAGIASQRHPFLPF